LVLRTGRPKSARERIHENSKQDVRAGDIFVVRDGTYLVGISCILLALLNAPIVRRQMRAKQFTRDIIDTLGKRLFEVLLPIPKDADKSDRIAKETREVIETRAKLRDRTKEIALEVEGVEKISEEAIEVLERI
jgi:type I restriction enzyme M protein